MCDFEALALKVQYVGSGEHKRFPNPLADPSLRSDATDCDAVDPSLSQDPARVQALLREVIRRGQVDVRKEGEFPRMGWGRLRLATGQLMLFEIRLTNAGLGAYKGYFISANDLVGKRAWVRKHLADGGAWSQVLV